MICNFWRLNFFPQLNICDILPEDSCGKFDGKYASSVCGSDGNGRSSPKASLEHSSLEYTSQGELTLTYLGKFNGGRP